MLVAEVFPRLLVDFPLQLETHFVRYRERTDRHARHPARVFDELGRDTLLEHVLPLDGIGAETAAREEAAAVVHHDRRLAQLADVIECPRNRLAARLAAD